MKMMKACKVWRWKKNKSNAWNESQKAYPEIVESEVSQTHTSDIFGELLQNLRVLCLHQKIDIYFYV